jgi:hypothetical protein
MRTYNLKLPTEGYQTTCKKRSCQSARLVSCQEMRRSKDTKLPLPRIPAFEPFPCPSRTIFSSQFHYGSRCFVYCVTCNDNSAIWDFGSKIVSKGYHLSESATGALSENEQLRSVIIDLNALNTRLQQGQKLRYSTKDEKALEDLSVQCSAIADELLFKLNKLKVAEGARFRKWKSFRQALKSVWNKEDLDKMAATLSEYRRQLGLHILVSLRQDRPLI